MIEQEQENYILNLPQFIESLDYTQTGANDLKANQPSAAAVESVKSWRFYRVFVLLYKKRDCCQAKNADAVQIASQRSRQQRSSQSTSSSREVATCFATLQS